MSKKKAKRKKYARLICKVCGVEFELKKENKYEVIHKERTLISGWQEVIFECFNCPMCGCQNVVNEKHQSE